MATLEPKKAIFEPKMAIFEPKPLVNPLGKMSIFLLFELLFLYSRKAFFLFRISLKIFSWPELLKKKKLEKWPFFDKNLWKNAKSSVFLTFCFYSVERRFFVLEYRKRHFPGLNCLKRKR